MNFTRRRFGLGTAALLAGNAVDASTPPNDRILKLALPSEPSTLDPTLTGAVTEARIVDELFEGLVSYDGALRIVPGAAERWTVSDDGLRYTFHLRAGLRYSNGEALPADDFVYALRRQLTPATAATGTEPLRWIRNAPELLRGKIKDATQLGVQAPDTRTVEVTLTRRDVSLLNAATRFFPLRRAAIEAAPRHWTRPGRLVGNGAYRMQAWVPNGRIELVRNPYWHGAAQLAFDGVCLTVLPDRGTAFKMFQTGELDVVRVPDERLAAVRRSYADQLRRQPLNGTLFLALRMRGTPFENNPKLRRALALATDAVTLVEKVQRVGHIPAFSLVSPGLQGYSPALSDFKDWPMPRRIDEARRLYAESGAPAGMALGLSYATDARTALLLQALASMWRSALGVQLTLDNAEPRVAMETFMRKRYTVHAVGWATSRVDPALLTYLANPDDNELDYVNPRYSDFISTATSAATPAERASAYAQAERVLMDDQPLIPIAHGVTHLLVSPRLRGWEPNLADAHPARTLSLAAPRAVS